ncbi:MAG: LacI family DNA-binding transcriptional regulator [Thermomicrobiales bacterium]|nr:LacI family DNA-binding transcriptional regulator [Thermomicrobiales bacterium]
MATIRDVAREAGVGVGTVSRVLGGGAQVAPATRERVEAAMARLGYRPNTAARALSQRRTHTLEVVVPLVTRHFYVEVLRGIEEALAGTDYAVVIRTIERPASRGHAFAALGQGGRADGVIVVSVTPDDDLLARLEAAKLPAVLVDAADLALPSVVVDHVGAAREATRYLLGLGHRRIAIADTPDDPFTPGVAVERQRGYRMALAEAGVLPRAEYQIAAEASPEGGAAACEALLALPEPPTAILACSDTRAVGVLQAARKLGKRVPRDLSIMGYGDIEMSRHLGLTTMRIPVRELGQAGVGLLLEALAEPPAIPPQITLEAELIVRRTAVEPGQAGGKEPPWPVVTPF